MKINIHDIDIKLLRVFRAVVRNQGFSAAQDELNATQSAISMNMTQLEVRLGMRLCDRGVKGFRLTQYGKAVLESTDRLFAAIDDFRTETEQLKGVVSGTTRIGIVDNISSSPQFKLPQAIHTLNEQYPEASIDLFVGGPQELEERLLDGRLKGAIGFFHRTLPKLSYQQLFSEQHELYCGDLHVLFSYEDNKISDDMIINSKYVGRAYLENLKTLRPPIPLNPVASSTYIEGLSNLILSGGYLAYLPTHYASAWVKAGKMRSIKPEKFVRTVDISFVQRKSRNIGPDIDTLLKALTS